jgi:hypothetical protein
VGIFWRLGAYLLAIHEKVVFSHAAIGATFNEQGTMDLLSIYAPANRAKMLALASFLIAAIAAVDWWATHYISLGFLYLFPIIIFGGFLSRTPIVAIALLCAVLQEAFSNLPESEAVIRLLFSSAGFVGTGLFISEMVRNRRIVLKHSEELEDAEKQLRSLIESSPAAIVDD